MSKNDNEGYIPENDELEEETNDMINVREHQEVTPGKVDFPEVEDEWGAGDYEADVAQQVGRFSDQVHLGSPAAEAGSIGKGALKETIEASKEKLQKKLNDKKNKK